MEQKLYLRGCRKAAAVRGPANGHGRTPERRARYWEDTALALHGRGRPAAYAALLAAEDEVPEEVRYRPWAQHLTRDLLTSLASHGLAGLREFATRVGVA